MVELSREETFWYTTAINQCPKDVSSSHAEHVVQGNGTLGHRELTAAQGTEGYC